MTLTAVPIHTKFIFLKGCEITDGYNCQKEGKILEYFDSSNRKVFLHFIYLCDKI